MAQRIVVAPAGSISEFKKDVVAGCHTRLVVHWRSLVKHPGNASGSPGGKGVKTLRVATPGGNVRGQRETPPRRGSAVNLRDPHRGAPIQDACSLGVSRLRSQRPATLTPAHRFKSSAERQRACLPTAMDPHNQRISPVSHFCTTSRCGTGYRERHSATGLKVAVKRVISTRGGWPVVHHRLVRSFWHSGALSKAICVPSNLVSHACNS